MTEGVGIRGLRQVSLDVDDVESAVAFYTEVLDLPLLARFGALAFIDLGGTRLLLETAQEQRRGNSILYFSVDDIHAVHAGLAKRGITFEDEPHVIHRDEQGIFGSAGEEEWMTFFRDPAGNLLALSSRRT